VKRSNDHDPKIESAESSFSTEIRLSFIARDSCVMKSTSQIYSPRPRRLNPRAAVILAVIVTALIFGMRKLHSRQLAKTIEFLRREAFAALQAKDPSLSQQSLSRYLALRPGDLEARERYSWVLAEHAGTAAALQQAFRINEDLIRKGFGDDELRLRQAEICVRIGQLADASAHLEKLRLSQPDNGKVWYLSGLVAHQLRDLNTARQCLQKSLSCPAGIPEAFVLLASLADSNASPEFSAESLLQRMATECPSAETWKIRAAFWMQHQQYQDAIPDLWKALNSDPASLKLNGMMLNCLMLADKENRISKRTGSETIAFQDQLHAFVKHLEVQVTKAPLVTELRRYLAATLHRIGNQAEAIRILEEGIQRFPREFVLHQMLMEYALADGDVAKATHLLSNVSETGLPRETRVFCEARIRMAKQDWDVAIPLLEQVVGYSEKQSDLHQRAQLCLAVCRSQVDDPTVAVDAFRHVLTSTPNSTSGRMGLARALAEVDQLDLAIAEYQQILSEAGVAAQLADLMIRRNLQQAPELRNWNEIDRLLSDTNPLIRDPAERILLKADRYFAAGEMLKALTTLEKGRAAYPDRTEIAAAIRRLQGDLSPLLEARLKRLIEEFPANTEVAAVWIHFLRSQGRDAEAFAILDNFESIAERADDQIPSTSNPRSLGLQVIRHLRRLGESAEGDRFREELTERAIRMAQIIYASDSSSEPLLVGTLLESQRSADALALLSDQKRIKADVLVRSESILTLVRFPQWRADHLSVAGPLMYGLVTLHPNNLQLRLQYADLMLIAEQYQTAEAILNPLAALPVVASMANSRRIWLRSVQPHDLAEADRILAEIPVVDHQRTDVATAIARLRLAQGRPDAALQVLSQIPQESATTTQSLYRAAAMQQMGQNDSEPSVLESLDAAGTDGTLFPADEALLRSLNSSHLSSDASDQTPDVSPHQF
jgi:tetratricopeptide (TPR) repeat protein